MMWRNSWHRIFLRMKGAQRPELPRFIRGGRGGTVVWRLNSLKTSICQLVYLSLFGKYRNE